MKRLIKVLFIFVICLNVCGCGCSKKEKIVTCTNKNVQSISGYTLESTYKIHYKKDIVTKIDSEIVITSEKKEILEQYENDLKRQYESNDKNYGGYKYDVSIKDEKLTAKVTIDYNKFDMDKFESDNSAMKEYLDDSKYTLDGAIKYYETTGNKCDNK